MLSKLPSLLYCIIITLNKLASQQCKYVIAHQTESNEELGDDPSTSIIITIIRNINIIIIIIIITMEYEELGERSLEVHILHDTRYCAIYIIQHLSD